MKIERPRHPQPRASGLDERGPAAGPDASRAHPPDRAAGVTTSAQARSLAWGPVGEPSRGPARAPPSGTPVQQGLRPLDVLATTRSMGSTRPWDPVRRLPEARAQLLGAPELARIQDAVATLQQQVREHKLDHVPVFGYLSLRTHNHAELGKKSQADVVVGRDVVGATLPDHDIDVVASSVFRGTPEHPGAVAGLAPRAGAQAPGVVLKLPLARAEELLAVVLARELFAEGDLREGVGADGNPVSNAMYTPVTTSVVVDVAGGPRAVPALVFMTNPEGAKAVSRPDAFGDGQGLTRARMAWLFAGQGGFVDASGRVAGGPTADYWQASYVDARRAAGQPVDPTIARALELSRLLPQQAVIDRLLARTDRDARLMTEALRVLFEGAATPLALHAGQKLDDKLVRTPAGSRGDDAPARLLDAARALERDGKLSID